MHDTKWVHGYCEWCFYSSVPLATPSDSITSLLPLTPRPPFLIPPSCTSLSPYPPSLPLLPSRYGAVKYQDLKNNRKKDYVFDYDRMLSLQGDTGVYLLYAHARIESILSKSGKDVAALFAAAGASIDLATPFDRDLAQHIVRFRDRLDYMMEELLPSVMCEYLHDLAQKLTTFYQNCPVLNGKTEADLALVDSRLRLLHTTAVTMRAAFHILALKPLYKI